MKLSAWLLAVTAAACAPEASNRAAPASPQADATTDASRNDTAAGAGVAKAVQGSGPTGGQGQARPRDVPIPGGGDRPSAPPGEAADQCGASAYQWLVGRPRSAIPERPAGATWRITCTSCPITQDFSAARLNIFYDSHSERIEEVRCG